MPHHVNFPDQDAIRAISRDAKICEQLSRSQTPLFTSSPEQYIISKLVNHVIFGAHHSFMVKPPGYRFVHHK
nr:Uncharacterised protein [Klebsiella pneumoniae]